MSEAASSFAPSTRMRTSHKGVIKFKTSTAGEYSFLSDTFSKVPVRFGTLEAPSSRHVYESMKFIDTDESIATRILKLIQSAGDASRCAAQNQSYADPNWNGGTGIIIPSFAGGRMLTRRDIAMIMSTYYKFLDPDLSEKLLLTGQDGLELTTSKEKNPYASIDDKSGTGENMLGNSLMLVRRIIKEQIRNGTRSEQTVINKRTAKRR